jgi:hypothetical protein
VPLSPVGPGGVGIFFLPSYPVAACMGQPPKWDTIFFFALTARPTSCQATATNFVGTGSCV